MSDRAEQGLSFLEGAWVVNTRSPRQAAELDVLLLQRSAHPVPYPCIDIAPPLDTHPLDAVVERLTEGRYDWLVFTSANAVEALEARLVVLGIPAERLAGAAVAAIGPGTAAAATDRLGLKVDLCPVEHIAESLAQELTARGARSVVIPQADRARETLGRILRECGVNVEAVTAYRTVLGSGGADVPGLLREGRIDAVVFASPSAVDNMASRLEQENGRWDDLSRVCVACIGPVTSAAAERRGLRVHVTAGEHTLPDLVDDLERYYRERTQKGDS